MLILDSTDKHVAMMRFFFSDVLDLGVSLMAVLIYLAALPVSIQ
jgi:hypothetical protein